MPNAECGCAGERERPDGPREACGLFGAIGVADAVRCCYDGLFQLQHRGQESAGIAAMQGSRITRHVGMGLVAEVFTETELAALGAAEAAIGHTRYSTTGRPRLVNAQPLAAKSGCGPIAVAHNGNFVNSMALREELEREGAIFQGTADSEVLLHLYARAREPAASILARIASVLGKVEGAFSLLFLVPEGMLGARDPQGWRPLWIGSHPAGGFVLASESCAFDVVGAVPLREVLPGEIVLITKDHIESLRFAAATPAHCVFEHIYFARPDSVIFGDAVYEVRKRLGRRLALEHPANADVVIPIPDSGTTAALGYAEASGIPFELGFVRSHYVGRTFINPSRAARTAGVRRKLAPVRSVIEGRRVVVIDDSIVRGTTARSRVRLLLESGATEVHFRVSCPPIRHPCHFGVDFPSREELIANLKDVAGIAREIGATTLGYLSQEGLLAAFKGGGRYCDACFSGRYPIALPETLGKDVHEDED